MSKKNKIEKEGPNVGVINYTDNIFFKRKERLILFLSKS